MFGMRYNSFKINRGIGLFNLLGYNQKNFSPSPSNPRNSRSMTLSRVIDLFKPAVLNILLYRARLRINMLGSTNIESGIPAVQEVYCLSPNDINFLLKIDPDSIPRRKSVLVSGISSLKLSDENIFFNLSA